MMLFVPILDQMVKSLRILAVSHTSRSTDRGQDIEHEVSDVAQFFIPHLLRRAARRWT